MKLNVEIDCTPEEARRFLGLPDVAPVQADIMEAVQSRVTQAIGDMDASELMAQWAPLTMKGVEDMQSFWTNVLSAGKKT